MNGEFLVFLLAMAVSGFLVLLGLSDESAGDSAPLRRSPREDLAAALGLQADALGTLRGARDGMDVQISWEELQARTHVQVSLPAGAPVIRERKGVAGGILIDDGEFDHQFVVTGDPAWACAVLDRAACDRVRSFLAAGGRFEAGALRQTLPRTSDASKIQLTLTRLGEVARLLARPDDVPGRLRARLATAGLPAVRAGAGAALAPVRRLAAHPDLRVRSAARDAEEAIEGRLARVEPGRITLVDVSDTEGAITVVQDEGGIALVPPSDER